MSQAAESNEKNNYIHQVLYAHMAILLLLAAENMVVDGNL